MNPAHVPKLLIVLLVAVAIWFVPPPAGLRKAGVLAEITQRSNLRFPQKKKVQLWEVARVMDAESEEVLATFDEELVSRIKDAGKQEPSPTSGKRAWQLFVIFAATIALILLDAIPVFVAAIGALSIAILTNTLTTAEGYSGFSVKFIILIVVAFTIAIGFAKSGLGERVAFVLISQFGQSTLGLAYSLIVTDILIAPAFPSNTARSGVLFPVVDSVARSSDSPPDVPERKRLGAFLVMASVVGLSLSSGLWLTAMAANPAGAELASRLIHKEVTFGSWFIGASLPTFVCLVVLPVVLHWVFPPEVKSTPRGKRARETTTTRERLFFTRRNHHDDRISSDGRMLGFCRRTES